MARKYLNDINIPDTLMQIDPNDNRWEKWNNQIKKYGFPEYETWCLDLHFYAWLYERLKMFLEVNCINLDYHKFTFKNKKYTQGELIDKMLYGCELALMEEFEDKKLTKTEKRAIKDVCTIWAIVLPAMWW